MYGITETTVHVTYRPLTPADLERGAGSVIGRPLPDLRALPARTRRCSRCPVGVRGRDLRRRRRRRPRLPEPAGADRRALRRRTRSRRAPARGSTAPATWPGASPDGDARVPRPHRPPGEDPRLPHRARRDRGGARGAPASCARRSSWRARTTPGDRRLVAYVVAGAGRASGIVQALRPLSPTGCPSTWSRATSCSLDALPLTANGKVDRKALPAPERQRAAGSSTPYVAPRTPDRGDARRRSGRGARRRAGRRGRQLLRARRRLDPQHPGGCAVPRRRPEDHASGSLPGRRRSRV